MSHHPSTHARLLLSAATAALLMATAACSSGGGGQGLTFAAGAPNEPSQGAVTETGNGAPGGSPVMESTPSGVTDVPRASSGGGGGGGGSGGGGGGGGGCTVNCTPTTPPIGGPDPGPNRRYATYNGRDDGTLSRLVDDANMLVSMGNADLAHGLLDPLAPTVNQLDDQLSPLGKIVLSDSAVVGSGLNNSSQQIGISALSNGAPSGDLVSLGLLNNDGAVTLSLGGNAIIPAGALPAVPTADINNALTQVASLNLGNSNLLGDAANRTGSAVSAVGVGLGSNGVTAGTLATANLSSNGVLGLAVGGSQLNSTVLGTAPITSALGDGLGQVSTQLASSGLNSNGVLGVSAGASAIGGAAPALLGVNIGSTAPVTGTLATVGVLQGGTVASVSSPLLSTLGLGGLTNTVNQVVASVPSTPSAPTGGGLGGLGGLLGGLGH